MEVVDMVVEKRGIKDIIEKLLSEEMLDRYVNFM